MIAEDVKTARDQGKPFVDFVKGQTNAIMQAHDLSMSNDPEIACMGRMLKSFLNAWDTAVQDEIKRETPPRHIVSAIMSSTASIIVTSVELLAKREERLPACISVSKNIAETCVASMIERLRQETQAKPKPEAAE